MMLIGQPKTLAEVKGLTDEEIAGAAQLAEQGLTSGTPVDMPAITLTILDFCRLIRTVQTAKAAAAAAVAPVAEAAPRIDLSRFIPPEG